MGYFLDFAALLKPQAEVEAYFEKVAEEDRGGCIGGLPDRTFVAYEEATGDFRRIRELSKALGCAVFALHVHDEDLWMYEFFVCGNLMDRFNTYPGYWQPIEQAERDSWRGNASVLAAHWPGLDQGAVERYLVHHDTNPPLPGIKAYPDDEFECGDFWQITDFLRKLGTPYPDFDS